MYKNVFKSMTTIAMTILGYLFGEIDGLMYALLALMLIDYATGIICAIIKKNLCSSIGFKGILKKVSILIIVSVSQIIDVNMLSDSGVLRSSVIAFYVVNEGISILENSSKIGIPLPLKLKNILKQLNEDQTKE